jgi:superfamily II DNA or RNA helicase
MNINKIDTYKKIIHLISKDDFINLFEISDDLYDIIKEDADLFTRIYKFVDKNINNKKIINQFLNGFTSQNYKTEKDKFTNYFNIIHKHINNQNCINYNIIHDYDIISNFDSNTDNNTDNNTDSDTDSNTIIDANLKFELRPNQLDIKKLLDNNQLQTGIHCQATGLGKSIGILLYINYVIEKYMNPNIILFTERVNILRDLFGFGDNTTKDKINYWKNIGVCDLTDINIINCVTQKTTKWVLNFNDNNDKGNLLIINRAYLTKKKNNNYLYENIIYDCVNLILHDECHNASSEECFNFLSNAKKCNVSIVGFSATPLRTGKDDIKRVLEIYGDDGQLKLLTNYNLLYSISNKLILPIKFFWYQLEKNQYGNMDIDKNLLSLAKLIDFNIEYFTNKKMVIWCGTIKKVNDMKKKIKENFDKYPSLSKFKFYVDHSQNDTKEYLDFIKEDKYSILLCANKHREGSDIRKLDSVIFMDGVKQRGAIPFIQSIGRPIRIDNDNPEKKYGIVIDGFFKSSNYELDLINKIFDYYMYLMNVSLGNSKMTKNELYWKAKDMIDFDVSNQKVIMKLGNEKVEINFNNFNLENIKNNFDSCLQQKIKLSAYDNIKNKGKLLKDYYGFHEYTDFYETYINYYNEGIFETEHNMPDISQEEYSTVFKNHSWFDILNLKHNFYETPETAIKELLNEGYNLNKAKKYWKELCDRDEKLPPYPKYVWGNEFDYKCFNLKDKYYF